MACCCLFVLLLALRVCTLKWGIYWIYIVPKCFLGILTTYVCYVIYIYIPFMELTYPTFGKGKSSLKVPWKGYVSSQECIYCEMKMGTQNRKREKKKLVMVRYAKKGYL